jgi:hypothetical protein
MAATVSAPPLKPTLAICLRSSIFLNLQPISFYLLASDLMKEDDMAQGRGPEDGLSRDGSREDSSAGKRKHTNRDPESPGQMMVNDVDTATHAKKERTYFADMDTDSPASYPKHVLVPTSERQHEVKQYIPHSTQMLEERIEQNSFPLENAGHGAQVLTPDSVGRSRAMANVEPQQYPPRHHQQHYQHDVYRAPSYTPDMDYGRSYGGGHPRHNVGGPPHGGESYGRPRRWACDFCNVATFLSYEEACAHEEACARRHHESVHYHDSYQRGGPRPPTAYNGASRGHQVVAQQGSGLGALYHASQEVVTPPTPYNQQQPTRWGSHAPPLPVLPAEQGFYRQGYYDIREDPAHFRGDPHYHPQANASFHMAPHDYFQKRILLAMPSDHDSLSDRQCYVRSEMVEIFAASTKDVSARHSKGAQKLVAGQVGIRCVHCSHLRPRDRAERAVCYPKSISRIYQTVADMQRFHFENCREIPDQVRMIYKKLKTTRPRGVGSPQSYWVSSAKQLGLADTDGGIRFDLDLRKDHHQDHLQSSDVAVHH